MDAENREQPKKEKIRFLIKKSTVSAFLFVFLYKISLDLVYYFVISQVWSYARFELHLNSLKLVESYLLLFIIFILMPKSKEKLSNVMVWLLVLLSYVPMLVLFAFMDQLRVYMYAVTGFWMLVFLLLKLPTVFLSPLKKIQSKTIRYSIFVGLSGIVFFIIYKYLGLSFSFDLTKVYDIRAEYVAVGVPFASYLFNWLAYIINPIFFALFLAKKKWVLVGLIVFLQALLFSVTGLKAFLFVLPFVLVLMWIVARKNPLAWIALGLMGGILLGMVSYWVIDDLWTTSLFARRALLVPAQLSFFYYDFFSENGPTFLSQHRVFRNFIDYPYHLNPPHLIGEVYFNSPETNANNGVYADAYMNFGFIGFALWAFLLTIILKLVDSFSRHQKITVTIAAIAMPSLFLTNSAFLTCLITHGLLLSLIILYLLPKEK
ncbi:MAG: oligosaccharide repeat unit polymerase [Candidatus Pacebacteria bacterium]|nr:oligosaccharide repeat unit polymerase [Candidatus Paceibacterota bacterium]